MKLLFLKLSKLFKREKQIHYSSGKQMVIAKRGKTGRLISIHPSLLPHGYRDYSQNQRLSEAHKPTAIKD